MRFSYGWRFFTVGTGFVFFTALLMGQGCPNASNLADLANSIISSSQVTGSSNQASGTATTQASSDGENESGEHHGGAPGLLNETFTSTPFTATFTPGQTGQPLDILVAGKNTGSRLTFTVTDPLGAGVASVTNPSSNISTTSFTPATVGAYTLTVTETGAASTLYVVHVLQPPQHGPEDGHKGGHGGLLDQTFTTAPITATFTPTQTGQVVDVVVAGNNSASRLTLTITDPGGATVASVSSPSANVSTATFTPETAGVYTLSATETGTASSLYVVHVRQPVRDGAELTDSQGTLLYGTFASAPIIATFTPAQTGQDVNVVVAGNDAASRVTFTVTDPSSATVASVTSPTTNASIVSFTPETAGAYTLTATETGTAANLYIVEIVQPLSAGMEFHHGGKHGALLFETFSSSPITATFAPKQAGELIDIVVAGGNTGSRLTFTVNDPSGSPVASVTNPSANASSTTFTASVAGTYTLMASETGTVATKYIVRVTQTSQTDVTFDEVAGPASVLLYQTFGSAPMTTTFAVTQAGKAVEVAMGGDNAASRLTLTVTDASAATVASVSNPSTNVSSVAFIPAAAGTYTVTATETGTASTLYAVEAVQPIHHYHGHH